MGKLQSLEMVRALAALLVVLFHSQVVLTRYAGHAVFGNAFGAGYRGVDLFFVLSGFIITYVHGGELGQASKLPSYLFKRLSRIYPSVWIMTALGCLVYLAGFGGAEGAGKLSLSSTIASALLLPQRGNAVVNVTWTLKYEVFFYALYAVSIWNRRFGVGLLLLWQAVTVLIALTGVKLGFAGFYFRSISIEFGMGIACAWAVARWDIGAKLPWTVFGVLAFGIGLFVIGMMLDDAFAWAGVMCASGSALIIYALVTLERSQALWISPALVFLGGASYAIYLVHFSAITLIAAILVHAHVSITDGIGAAVAAASVLLGVAFDRFADRPIQFWLRHHKRIGLSVWRPVKSNPPQPASELDFAFPPSKKHADHTPE